jgi:hypothetical protein
LGTTRVAIAATATAVTTTVGGSAAAITTAATIASTTTVAAAVATTIGRSTTHATRGATHVTSRRATTATTTTAAAATTAEAGALTSNVLEEAGNVLVSLLQELEKVSNDATVTTVEEGGGQTSVAGTPGTTNTMNIVVDIGRKVVVDDVSDIRNIQSFRRSLVSIMS